VKAARCLIAATAVLLCCGGCGTTRVLRERPGVLVITLEAEGSPDVSMPLHLFVRHRNGRLVDVDELHAAPVVLLVKPGSYLVTAMPGCRGAVTVPRSGTRESSVAAVARVLLSGRSCDVRQIE
jgi:hypothetical protein